MLREANSSRSGPGVAVSTMQAAAKIRMVLKSGISLSFELAGISG
jgi:hypothetical protein